MEIKIKNILFHNNNEPDETTANVLVSKLQSQVNSMGFQAQVELVKPVIPVMEEPVILPKKGKK
jgi:hypothetical protein